MTHHTYSTPFGGREIYRNGEPFALITFASDVVRQGPNYDPVALSDFGKMAAAAPLLVAALEELAAVTPSNNAPSRIREIAERALASVRSEGAVMTRSKPDLIYWRDDLFTRFHPETKAGEDAWRMIAANCDGTAAVFHHQEASTLRQLRAAGYIVAFRRAVPVGGMTDDEILRELGC